MSTAVLVASLVPWLVANVALAVPTLLLWRRLRLGSAALDAAVLGFLHAFVCSIVVMALALAGMLRPLPAFLAAAALGGVLGFWRRHELVRTGGRLLRTWGTMLRDRGRHRLDAALSVLAALIVVRFAAHVWWLPPYVRDTLTYHLPKVAEWIRAGELVVFETPVDRTFWPGGFELLQTWVVLFAHHDFAIELAGVAFYLLACTAVAALARAAGLSRRGALVAAAIFALTPAPLQHATTGKNDLPIAALALLLFALVLDGHSRWTRSRRRSILVLLILAVGLGMKPTLVFVLPGVALLAAGGVWRRRSLRDLLRREIGAPRPAATALLLLAGGLLAGYWFLRNGLAFGNPFYPAEPRLFGRFLFGEPAAGPERQGVFLSLDALGRNLETFLGEKIFDRQPFHSDTTDMTGWGWFAFCCGWPTLLVGLGISARFRWLAAGFLASLAGVLASVVADPWHMRFAQWFPALFAVSFLLVLRWLPDRLPRLALATLASGCLALNFLGSLDIGVLAPADWARMARLPLAERSSARLGLFFGRRIQDVLDRVPAGEPIGYTTNSNGFVYPLYDADFSRSARYVPLEADSDVVVEMRRRGVVWLFASLPPLGARQAIATAGRQGRIHRVGEELFVLAE